MIQTRGIDRDVLIGCAAGTVALAVSEFGRWLPARLGLPAENLAWIGPCRFSVRDMSWPTSPSR